MKWVLRVVVLLGLLLIAGVVVLASILDTFQLNRYSSCAEARADQLFERGWIPDVLPAECGHIVEAHELDMNLRCSRSSFQPTEVPSVVESLRVQGYVLYTGALPRLPFTNCPFSLAEAQAAEHVLRGTRLSSDREYAAVSQRGELFVWSAFD